MPRPKQFNEEEVLTKAMELFWKKGFHATSMQDLISHLGINRASLYDTFDNKETLFKKAFDLYCSSAGSTIHAFFKDASTVKEGFQKMFNKTISDQYNDPSKRGCFVVNTTTELVSEESSLCNDVNKHMEAVVSIFEGYIQKGMLSGEIDASKNARQLALFMYTTHNGLQVVSKANPSPDKLNAIASIAIETL